MDGVFDLFHVGHLEAIRQCADLGKRVIIGVTGDKDAAGYKRPPIMTEGDRVASVRALREVDAVVCPCPFVVTEEFMKEQKIDLVVHGFANDADAK
jgi:cytidyltransferase-like protein